MRLTPELRQMLRDAARARARRPAPVRVWHALAERIDVVRASADDRRADRPALPKGPLMLFDDLHLAWRRLRARPGSALAAAAMLALAIGVTGAMFTITDHYLWHPAPFRDPASLARVSYGAPGRATVYLPPDVPQQLATAASLAGVAAAEQASVTVRGPDGLTTEGGARVTPGLFALLGVQPLIGRTFTADDTPDRVVIAESIWRSVFGADSGIIGRTVTFGPDSVTVVGVMPAGFAFPYGRSRVWRPLTLSGSRAPARVEVFARLAAGTSIVAAEDDATRQLAGLPAAKPDSRVKLTPITEGFLDVYARRAIAVLTGGVVLVFVIFCVNASGLILARTEARRAEFAIASSLGATRARLIRQSVVENAVIGLTASLAGFAIAWWLTGLAVAAMPESMVSRTLNAVTVDFRAVLTASLLGLVATLAAGLPPAWLGTRVNAADSLRLSVRGATATRAARRWSRVLLAGEVAMATSLLVGAGVLTLSFTHLMNADAGLDLAHVTTASVSFPSFEFADKASRLAIADAVTSELRSLPGVSAATASFGAPPRGGAIYFGDIAADSGGTWSNAVVTSVEVQPGFFDVFGIRLVAGRGLLPEDGPEAVVVGRALGDRLWPGVSPVGHSFTLDQRPYRVVGVAAEVRNTLNDPTSDAPEFYENFRAGRGLVMIGLRCPDRCPPVTTIRERIRAVSPNVMIDGVTPLAEAYRDQFDRPRAAASIAAMFAGVAVLASAGGLFSVLTVTVGQRRRELGVRLALGARREQIRAIVAIDGLAVVGLGLAIGAVGAWAASTFLASLAYGVSAADPLVWSLVIGTLIVAALAAIWRPARAAGRLDPMELLRE